MKYHGLTDEQVKERQKQGLVNIDDHHISKSKKQIIIEHTFTYFNFLNIFLAMIIIFTGHFKNLTFVGVVFTNTFIGIIQELKVKKILDNLEVITVRKTKVIRNSQMIEIPVEQLVIDDIVCIENGHQIATDCQILTHDGIEVNESLLTGEAKPIRKKVNDELLAGSFLVAGSALAKVIRVGHDNYATKLASKAKNKNRASSQMKDAIEKMIKVLSIIIIPVGLALFYSQVNTSQSLDEAIVHTVAGVVGMIPEGLVLLTSISFIIGVGKLAHKNALIQEMEAIESLARVDVLCLDKTGTITTGELKVNGIYLLDDSDKEYVYYIMGMIAYAFNDVNSTQNALKEYFKKEDCEILDKIPFSSQRKYRAIQIKDEGAFVLGAPEYLLDDQKLLQKGEEYSERGLRILLLASIQYMNSQHNIIEGIHPLSFIIIEDCIRDEAISTIEYFQKNNVDIKILSGDHPLTVSKIASIAKVKNAECYMDASLLPESIEELSHIVERYTIFGRVKPEQKQMLIQALQRNRHITAMVGDGVNDVLALKEADCGIALALGSDAARQAAHVVLLDSNFASMKEIIKEGRSIIANIERVSSLYLTKTIYSTILSLFFIFLDASYPFTPLQLSLMSSLAIGIPSFFLTLESSALLNDEGFFKHVIKISLPCALTQIIYTIMIRFIGMIFDFNETMFSTYYFLTTGFISFIVVFIVCLPLNKRHIILISILITLFCLVILFIPSFFNIYPIYHLEMIGIVPLCLSSLLVMGLLKRFIYDLNVNIKSHSKD